MKKQYTKNMKKQYTKKQILEAIEYWKKLLETGNYKSLCESKYTAEGLRQYCNLIVKQLPILREIYPVVTDLFKRGKVKYYGPHYQKCYNKLDLYNKFMTDGLFHNLGFYGNKGLFGCKGGGDSGYSLFVNIYTGEFMTERHDKFSDKVDVDTFVEIIDDGALKHRKLYPGEPYMANCIMEKAERIATEIKKYVKMVERAAAGEDICVNNDPWDDPYGEKNANKTVKNIKTFTIDYTAWHKDKYLSDIKAENEAEAKVKFLQKHPEQYDLKDIKIVSITEQKIKK